MESPSAKPSLITSERARRIRESLAIPGAELGSVIAAATEKTLAAHPELSETIPMGVSEQNRRLVDIGEFLVRRLERLHVIDVSVVNMGVALSGFSVRRAHTAAFRRSLIESAREHLGAEWSAEIAADWGAATDLIEQMLWRGMRADEAQAAA